MRSNCRRTVRPWTASVRATLRAIDEVRDGAGDLNGRGAACIGADAMCTTAAATSRGASQCLASLAVSAMFQRRLPVDFSIGRPAYSC